MKIDFQPKLLVGLRHYSREKFIADLMAGIIVGIVALPLAIAFGIASGVTPEKGLITAIVGGFIVSALGGSSVQIGGPTGAFIVIVMTGLNQNMMQKNLTCKTLREAQKDVCSYGFAFVPVNLLFLSLGVLLIMLADR